MFTTRFIHDWEQRREPVTPGSQSAPCDRSGRRGEDKVREAKIDQLVERAQLAQRTIDDWDEPRIDALRAGRTAPSSLLPSPRGLGYDGVSDLGAD